MENQIVHNRLKLALNQTMNPTDFIGEGWSFWRGPVDGNGLEGEDDYILEPNEVDFEQIVLETHFKDQEIFILGEEKMRRARASHNRQLGDKTFFALWNNYLECLENNKGEDSVLWYLHEIHQVKIIYFFGRTLRDSNGLRYVVRFEFDFWHWSYFWLGSLCNNDPCIALKSIERSS